MIPNKDQFPTRRDRPVGISAWSASLLLPRATSAADFSCLLQHNCSASAPYHGPTSTFDISTFSQLLVRPNQQRPHPAQTALGHTYWPVIVRVIVCIPSLPTESAITPHLISLRGGQLEARCHITRWLTSCGFLYSLLRRTGCETLVAPSDFHLFPVAHFRLGHNTRG